MNEELTPYLKDVSPSGIIHGYYREPMNVKDLLQWNTISIEYKDKDLGYISNKYIIPKNNKENVHAEGTYLLPREISLEKALQEINAHIKLSHMVHAIAKASNTLRAHETKRKKTRKIKFVCPEKMF